MPQKCDDTVHILEGKATLFRRPLTPHWQVRFKAHGKWLRATTQCEDLKDAKDKAVDLVTNAWFRERNKLPVISKRFATVAKLAINRMRDLEKAKQGKATYKTYIQAIESYLIPFFGNHNIDRIDNTLMRQFEQQRIVLMKRVPAASTLNNHNSALSRVFDEALEHGYMTRTQVPLIRNDGIKSERRPDFTPEEYVVLHRGMRRWVKKARKGNETRLRNVLREYVLVLANTGIRAGTEGMNLKWQHIANFVQEDRQYLALTVTGKTGTREVIARSSTESFLDRLRKQNPDWAAGTFEEFLKRNIDAYVFRVNDKDMTTTFGRMFARLLDQLGLLKDPRTGKERTLYSLRHTYATRVLTYNRVSIYNLSKIMGTSVAMLEKHYGHVQLRNLAHQIAGMGKDVVVGGVGKIKSVSV